MPILDPFSILPAELSLKVLSQGFPTEADLVPLWTSFRHVSHLWRALVDEYVRIKHLPTTSIGYSLLALSPPEHPSQGSHYLSRYNYSANFTFDRVLPQDSNIALFSDQKNPEDASLRGIMLCKLHQSLSKADNVPPWRYPLHITSIRHFANDTLIPGLEIDWVTLRLRCDWKALLTHLLYEEKLRLHLAQKWISGIGAGWIARASQTITTPIHFVRKETLPYRRCGAWHDNSSREARKRRMMRYSAESEGLTRNGESGKRLSWQDQADVETQWSLFLKESRRFLSGNGTSEGCYDPEFAKVRRALANNAGLTGRESVVARPEQLQTGTSQIWEVKDTEASAGSKAESGKSNWVANIRDFAKIQELKDARLALDRIEFEDERVDGAVRGEVGSRYRLLVDGD